MPVPDVRHVTSTILLLLSVSLAATVVPATARAAPGPPATRMLFTPAASPAHPQTPADPTALRQRWVQVDQALLAGATICQPLSATGGMDRVGIPMESSGSNWPGFCLESRQTLAELAGVQSPDLPFCVI